MLNDLTDCLHFYSAKESHTSSENAARNTEVAEVNEMEPEGTREL